LGALKGSFDMAKSSTKYKKYLTPNNIFIGIAASIILIIVAILVGKYLFSNNLKAPINQDQIMIQKGGNTIIVNRNGLIEYRSGDEVFYKTWDSSKINYFFDRMEAKARDYLDEGLTEPCDGCYAVTLYIDGKLVTVYIKDDEDLDDVFEEFVEDDLGDIDLSDYFDDDENNGDSQGNETITATPTPAGGGSDPTPTPEDESDDPQTNYPPVETGCSAWSQDIVDKAVISNTLCTIVEE
jgi:hypothetical protein